MSIKQTMASTSDSTSAVTAIPKVLKDPRWLAGRTLVQTGRVQEGAIDIFATLLEETINKHGDSSLDAAACYFEYGNALLRSALIDSMPEDDDELLLQPPDDVKDAAASAAESRLAAQQDGDSKPAAQDTTAQSASEKEVTEDEVGEEEETEETANDEKDDEEKSSHQEDCELALELMENAFAIMEEKSSPDNEWILRQLPRILQGLGDVLRELNRMADAADAFSRAIPHRQRFCEAHDKDAMTLDHLKDRRLLSEANGLVAEGLLACEDGQDVVTSETKDVLVAAGERVDFARGYYNSARDELQEAVYLMGQIASLGIDLGTEKEDVCFTATLLMGVGETLAACDESEEVGDDKEPAMKKLKSTK